MKATFVIVIAAILGISFTAEHGFAQGKPGVEKLYILNCGEGVAGDISFWSPGVNVGKTMDFSVNCYLIKHAQGWLLWDTGTTDAIAAMPGGLGPAPANPRLTRYRRTKTLASELDLVGVKPSGHQICCYLPHSPGPHRQRRDVPALNAAGSESGV
jgi:N-acyl homoserine lactone hydrolase